MDHQPDQRHMGGIIPIEELSQPAQFSALAVVKGQQRNREPARHVQDPVSLVVEDKERDSVQGDDGHEPEHRATAGTKILFRENRKI